MNQDHPRRTLDDGCSKNLSWMNQGGVQDTAGNQNIPDNPVLSVQKKGVELLLPEIPEERPHSGEDISWTSYRLVFPSRFHRCTAPEFHGRDDSSRGCGPDSRLGLKDSRRKGGKSTKGILRLGNRRLRSWDTHQVPHRAQLPGQRIPELMKDMIRHIQRRSRPSTATDENRQQFPNGKDGGP